MQNCRRALSVLFLPLFIGGCGLALQPLSPITYISRVNPISYVTVEKSYDPQKQIILKESLIYFDSIFKSEGIRFPTGSYDLEAENDDYYYFAAPEKLEFRIFEDDGSTSCSYYYAGGVFLTKNALNLVPGGAYYNINDQQKVHFWKLGMEFIVEKGNTWDTTY